MKLFTVNLTDDEREHLETVRRQEGLRSQADAVRLLIKRAVSSGLPTREEQSRIATSLRERQSQPVQPFKSRLKGEWKAP